MAFKLLILEPENVAARRSFPHWPESLKKLIPGIEVTVTNSMDEAMKVIGEIDAAFGDIEPELFQHAKKLRWISAPLANPSPSYFHQALIDSDVEVTNTRGIYNDHIGHHIVSFVLAFARGLPFYAWQQHQHIFKRGGSTWHLPESTAVIVGVGGVGAEAGRLCHEFGMTVIGVDPRIPEAPPGFAELHRPDALHSVLPKADFLAITVPLTPDTKGMFGKPEFDVLKKGAVVINIGRGQTVVLNDLVDALQSGQVGGAGLDVYDIEPLPAEHPLWDMSNVMMTPHSALTGPYLEDRRSELFLENCMSFDKGEPLKNVVDKAKWF